MQTERKVALKTQCYHCFIYTLLTLNLDIDQFLDSTEVLHISKGAGELFPPGDKTILHQILFVIIIVSTFYVGKII